MESFSAVSFRGFMILAVMCVVLAGCSKDTTAPPKDQPPTLPPAALLNFNLSYFDQDHKPQQPASRLNYANAAGRVVVISAVTALVLTPPVSAFALAVNTTPTRQPDGNWLWVYTYVYGDKEVQVRLRGKAEVERTLWEMKISSNAMNPPITNARWFDGESRQSGRVGTFYFYNVAESGQPPVARLDWSDDSTKQMLTFTDLDEHPGNTLAMSVTGPACAIDFTEAATHTTWFIHWNTETQAGSIKAPDYDGGQEACWDGQHNDVSCP